MNLENTYYEGCTNNRQNWYVVYGKICLGTFILDERVSVQVYNYIITMLMVNDRFV